MTTAKDTIEMLRAERRLEKAAPALLAALREAVCLDCGERHGDEWKPRRNRRTREMVTHCDRCESARVAIAQVEGKD